MSENTLVTIVGAIITGIPPTLVALAAYRQGVRNEVKAKENTQAVLVETDKIHELTNSNLTKVKSDLMAATSQIEELQTLVATLVEQKKALIAEGKKEP